MRYVLALLLLASCSALPTTRGSVANAIDDRLEPVAQGLDAVSLVLDTLRQTLRQMGSRADSLERGIENAQARAANAEQDNRVQGDAIEKLRDAGLPEETLGWIEVALIALGVTGGAAAGTAGAKAGGRALVRKALRPGGGPVEPKRVDFDQGA